jgi:hypothetical protein
MQIIGLIHDPAALPRYPSYLRRWSGCTEEDYKVDRAANYVLASHSRSHNLDVVRNKVEFFPKVSTFTTFSETNVFHSVHLVY